RQGVPILADRAYTGASPWVTTSLKRPPGGELTLKCWQIFRRSRISLNRMTVITKAVLTLERQH
ncbi:IS5/IS1182 family transposase, partial [Streptomyces nigrescens]